MKISKLRRINQGYIAKYDNFSIDDLEIHKTILKDKVERSKIVISVFAGIIIALYFSDYNSKFNDILIMIFTKLFSLYSEADKGIVDKLAELTQNAVNIGIVTWFIIYLIILLIHQHDLVWVSKVLKTKKSGLNKNRQEYLSRVKRVRR